MKDEIFKKFAKISFRLCITIGIISIVYLFVGVYIFDLQINAWFAFFMGIALLLYVPKPLSEAIEEEKRDIPVFEFSKRRLCGVFIFF